MSLPKGLITQSFAILGVATIAAGIHWGFQPLWVDPFEGFRPAPSPFGNTPPRNAGPAVIAPDQAAQNDPTSQTPQTPAQPSDTVQADAPLATNIGTPQSFALYESNQADFLDARANDIYQAGHIAGAYSTPYTIAAQRVAQLMADGFIDPSRRVVVYCIGGTCDESKFVVRALLEAGFAPDMVHIDDDGYPAWAAAGHPTGTGPDITQETP